MLSGFEVDMLIKHVLSAAALWAIMAGAVHAQDWEQQEEPAYGGEMAPDYVQEEYVQEDYVQDEYVQDEYVPDQSYEEPQYDPENAYQQEEPVQEEYVQDEYVQEEPQYEQPEEFPADSALENDWVQQMGSQCAEYADADGLEGEERDEFMRSCMQQ